MMGPIRDARARLTAVFETSLTATGIRFVELSGDYALVISKNAQIARFVRGRNFPFFINAA